MSGRDPSTLSSQLDQFLPKLETCKRNINKKIDFYADKLSKYKLYKAKVQKNIELYTFQYEIIENDLSVLQEQLQEMSGTFNNKEQIATLKSLKEDSKKLLEVFVYIQTGKENSSFEHTKSYFQTHKLMDLNMNFMDYSSIEISKVAEIWTNRYEIQKSIYSSKAFAKHQTIMSQVLDWILTFYEIVIKSGMLENIESMYHENAEKKESFQAQFVKNEYLYKYFKQLYQQLQNYIQAIQQKSPMINEQFAESLTKLIEEIFRSDAIPDDDIRRVNSPNNRPQPYSQPREVRNRWEGSPPPIRIASNTQYSSLQESASAQIHPMGSIVLKNYDSKLQTIPDNKTIEQDNESNENNSFKTLLGQQHTNAPSLKKRQTPLIKVDSIQVYDKDSVGNPASNVASNENWIPKKIERKRSNSVSSQKKLNFAVSDEMQNLNLSHDTRESRASEVNRPFYTNYNNNSSNLANKVPKTRDKSQEKYFKIDNLDM